MLGIAFSDKQRDLLAVLNAYLQPLYQGFLNGTGKTDGNGDLLDYKDEKPNTVQGAVEFGVLAKPFIAFPDEATTHELDRNMQSVAACVKDVYIYAKLSGLGPGVRVLDVPGICLFTVFLSCVCFG